MSLQDVAKKLISQQEGRKSFPYTDTTGHLTIGIGRNLTTKGLSSDEIDYLFQNDINEVIQEITKIYSGFQSLSEARQAVLCSMAINMGIGGVMSFRQMFLSLENQNYKGAAEAMLNSLWARQVPSRAQQLSYIMENDILK